ncbi:MAG: GIY-YIG nuclease family protein [Ruminococcaceae bacterium]|nr:GIY-YIG nuclease family protein [Oscillospiraceae bacterium]
MLIVYVYIITNKSNSVLYIGVTNDIHRRLIEHKLGINDSFSKRYSLDKLVYCEKYDSPEDAILREKQLKGWVRKKKNNLIEAVNPDWNDLSEQY